MQGEQTYVYVLLQESDGVESISLSNSNCFWIGSRPYVIFFV